MSKARSTIFPNGVSNASVNSFEALTNLRTLDPTKIHTYFEDFDYYLASDWAITGTNPGTPALVDGDGGLLLLAPVGADNDATLLQQDEAAFRWATGKEMWFKGRLQVSEVIQSDSIAGLVAITATVLAPADGIYFISDDGAATVDFVIEKNSTETRVTGVVSLVAATNIELAWHYDGIATIRAYADDILVATVTDLDNVPDDVDLSSSFGVRCGEAAAKTMTVDYLLAAKER